MNDAARREREIAIARALIEEAARTADQDTARRLALVALRHLDQVAEPVAA
jgi:class 3 adenylate cyclase